MKRIVFIILIFSNTALLLSQNFIESSFELKENMYFKKGYKIDGSDKIAGELISIKLNQAMNSKTGLKSEVFFKPNGTSNIPPGVSAVYVKNEGYYIFDTKDIDKIISFITSCGFYLNVEPPVFKSRLITFLYHDW